MGTLGSSVRYGDYGGSIDRLARSAERLYNSSNEQLRLMCRTVRDAYDNGTLENALFTSSKATSISGEAQAQFNGVYRATQEGQVVTEKTLQEVKSGFWATVGSGVSAAWSHTKQSWAAFNVQLSQGLVTPPTFIFVPRILLEKNFLYDDGPREM